MTYTDSNNSRAPEQLQFKINSLEYSEFNSRRINKELSSTGCPFMSLEESKTLPQDKLLKNSKDEVGPKVSKQHHGAQKVKEISVLVNTSFTVGNLVEKVKQANFDINCY